MDMKTESVAYRLRKALSLRNMRQQELSEKTGISKGSISQYMSGYAEPKVDRTYLMAQALNVNPVWLMGFDAPMDKESENERQERTFNRLSVYLGKTFGEEKISPKLLQLVEDFMKLNSVQQESVLVLVHSMIPNTNQPPYKTED